MMNMRSKPDGQSIPRPPSPSPPFQLSVNNTENSQYLFILTALSKSTQMLILAYFTSFPEDILSIAKTSLVAV
jgi:hypothetical protein